MIGIFRWIRDSSDLLKQATVYFNATRQKKTFAKTLKHF